MPGFITHYIFGCQVIKEIDNKHIKKVIKDNINVYSLGLQGPDLLFYFPYSFTGNRKRLASVMHVYETGSFFENLIDEISKLNGNEQYIGIAYLYGFLGHYSLDTECHPYIYYRTGYLSKGRDYFGKHTDFETDIDNILYDRVRNKKVVDFRQEKTIKLNKKERSVVASLLNNACKKTYPYIKTNRKLMEFAIDNFYYLNGMLNDKKGYKKKVFEFAEKIILGNVSASPLFMVENKNTVWDDVLNDNHKEWKNPWNMKFKSSESFQELMQKAKIKHINMMELIESEFSDSNSINYDRVRETIRSDSYHSGLDCSIPS